MLTSALFPETVRPLAEESPLSPSVFVNALLFTIQMPANPTKERPLRPSRFVSALLFSI